LQDNSLRISKRAYRNIFFVQNRDYWFACPFDYDKDQDIVLSFDFAVVHLVRLAGGEAQYIDHVVDTGILEEYNYKTYKFFASWHYNKAKEDIFRYRGIEIGSAFRIEIWNDITFYVRIVANIHAFLSRIQYDNIYSGIDNVTVHDVFRFLKLKAINWTKKENSNTCEYYFPIHQWMEEKLHPSNFKYKLKISVIKLFFVLSDFVKLFGRKAKMKKNVYVERYYPTDAIISEFKKENNIRMVRSDFNSITDMFSGLHLPVFVDAGDAKHAFQAKRMLEKFEREKSAVMFFDNLDISKELFALIIKRISPLLAKHLTITDLIINYFRKNELNLMITYSSIGVVNRLVINYCKKSNIPIYMVINGLLANSFLDEAKQGTWINSYGDSVKSHYFRDMDNIVCLGDPRMDKYSYCQKERRTDYAKPIIGIGASGFTNVDLNCYLAIEFEFLKDVLNACQSLKKAGREMDIVIKIRSNGYIQQYRNFLDEYFPDMSVRLFENAPMKEFLEEVDFFISIYSQTLFEASCLGIPVLYYKNDTQIFHPPFDGKSELVTAFSQEDLVRKIEAFYNSDAMYDAFKEKANMEKYIGPLDGQNLKRNMDFIYSLMQNN